MHQRPTRPPPNVPKSHYDAQLKHDPKRFRRKIRAELKRRDMTTSGAVERLLYLALLNRAGTMPSPTGKGDWDSEVKRQAHKRLTATLRRVASAHSTLARAENLGRDYDMVGVRRLLYSSGLKDNDLVEIINFMRLENVALPDKAFDDLEAYCTNLTLGRKSNKPHRSPTGKLGRRICLVARELEAAA